MKIDNIDKFVYPRNSNYNCYSFLSKDVLKDMILKYLEMLIPNVTSCTSAVIDSKIEQAMDLVKRHLLYAMHEEVEVLKEHIVVLLERIKQLEAENEFLKSNATPEILLTLGSVTAYKAIEFDEDVHTADLEVAEINANAENMNNMNNNI